MGCSSSNEGNRSHEPSKNHDSSDSNSVSVTSSSDFVFLNTIEVDIPRASNSRNSTISTRQSHDAERHTVSSTISNFFGSVNKRAADKVLSISQAESKPDQDTDFVSGPLSNMNTRSIYGGTGNKKQSLAITNSGEFVDDCYHEATSSSVISTLIGRKMTSITSFDKSKHTFTESDIACKGYLEKKGSWVKSWKRRYFILRQDIKTLSYYESHDSLILLGTVPLLSTTIVRRATALEEQTNGNKDTIESMFEWISEIVRVIDSKLNDSIKSSDCWTLLFDKASTLHSLYSCIELKSTHTTAASPNSITSNSSSSNPKSTTTTAGSTGNSSSNGSNTIASSNKHYSFLDINYMKYFTSQVHSVPVIAGHQIYLNLCNICPSNARLIATMSGYNADSGQSRVDANAWHDLSQTEVFNVGELSSSSENGTNSSNSITNSSAKTLSQVTVPFCLLQPCVMQTYSEVMITVYILGHEEILDEQLSVTLHNHTSNSRTNDKGNSSSSGHSIRKQTILCICSFDSESLSREKSFKMDMKVNHMEAPSASASKGGKVTATLGIITVMSKDIPKISVYYQRLFNAQPYSEVLYSFPGSNSDSLLSLEQLFVCKLTLPLTCSFVSFLRGERLKFYDICKKNLQLENKNKLSSLTGTYGDKYKQSNLLDADVDFWKGVQSTEKLAHMLEDLSQVSIAIIDASIKTVMLCEEILNGNCENLLIPMERGGAFLRRSTWKKDATWAMITTNLNYHMMTSQHAVFQTSGDSTTTTDTTTTSTSNDINSSNTGSSNNGGSISGTTHQAAVGTKYTSSKLPQTITNTIDVVPTITLGVPAAHSLKFHDGGLRRLLGSSMHTDERLYWLHTLQSSRDLNGLKNVSKMYPASAARIFNCDGISFDDDPPPSYICPIILKKHELARRIDICSSQILGFAIACIKCIITLAITNRGPYIDVLARSLRIGFLLNLSSMLSSAGDELGMLEDCEVAAEWLSLVTIRFISNKTSAVEGSSSSSSIGGSGSGSGGSSDDSSSKANLPVFRFARNRDGRLILDMVVTSEEVAIIQEAHALLSVLDHLYYQEDVHVPIDTIHNPNITNGMNSSPSSNSKSSSDGSKHRRGDPTKFNRKTDSIFNDVEYTLHGVTKIICTMFTQGVNEMQTMTNLRNGIDAKYQHDINKSSLLRLMMHYTEYRKIVKLQQEYLRGKIKVVEAAEKELILSMRNTVSDDSKNSANRGTNYTTRNTNATSRSTSVNASTRPTSIANSYESSLKDPIINYFSTTTTTTTSSSSSSSICQVMQNEENRISKYISNIDRLMDNAVNAINTGLQQTNHKHVHILICTSALCREIGGVIGILCKSGKDRTSMGATLEIAKGLKENSGVSTSSISLCNLLRLHGCRRACVYANIGSLQYAFHHLQRSCLPTCYRPPVSAFGGGET